MNKQNGSLINSLEGHTSSVLSVCVTPDDGSLIISGSLDKMIYIWDI